MSVGKSPEEALALFKHLEEETVVANNPEEQTDCSPTNNPIQNNEVGLEREAQRTAPPLQINRNDDVAKEEENCFTVSPRPPEERTALHFSPFKGNEEVILSPKGRFERNTNDDWRLVAPGSLKELTSNKSTLASSKDENSESETPRSVECNEKVTEEAIDPSPRGLQKAVQLLMSPARRISRKVAHHQSANGQRRGRGTPASSVESTPVATPQSGQRDSTFSERPALAKRRPAEQRSPARSLAHRISSLHVKDGLTPSMVSGTPGKGNERKRLSHSKSYRFRRREKI